MIATPPPPIVQIAQRTQRQEHGIVVYRLRRVFDVHAGPMHRHDELVLAIASRDDTIVKVRVVRASTGGKIPDANGVAQIEGAYEHPAPQDVFHRPFDPAYTGEYSFEPLDARTYKFTSAMRDSSHGDGTFVLDANDNVVQYQYHPYVLPRYSTSGTVTVQRAEVLPRYWTTIRETHEYGGHYAIFSAGATVVITHDAFARYPDLASAEAALQAVGA